LRTVLEKFGYVFESDTDTEAVAKLAKSSADLQTALREVEDLRAQLREAKGSLERSDKQLTALQDAGFGAGTGGERASIAVEAARAETVAAQGALARERQAAAVAAGEAAKAREDLAKAVAEAAEAKSAAAKALGEANAVKASVGAAVMAAAGDGEAAKRAAAGTLEAVSEVLGGGGEATTKLTAALTSGDTLGLRDVVRELLAKAVEGASALENKTSELARTALQAKLTAASDRLASAEAQLGAFKADALGAQEAASKAAEAAQTLKTQVNDMEGRLIQGEKALELARSRTTELEQLLAAAKTSSPRR